MNKKNVLLILFLFTFAHSFDRGGNNFGDLKEIPISIISVSNYKQNEIPKFTYLAQKIKKLKRVDPEQIKDIEEIFLIDERKLKDLENQNLEFPYIQLKKNFIEQFKNFLNSNKFDKQLIGFKKEDYKIVLYAAQKTSNFIEKNLSKSIKKSVIWTRQGKKININLKTKFIKFSKQKLNKYRLNGAIALLTKKGKQKLENYLNLNSLTIAQATITGTLNKKVFGGKGTIAIPVSPLQKQIVNDNDKENLDLIINLNELTSFGENNKLPTNGSVIDLPHRTLSIMRTFEEPLKEEAFFAIAHLLHLIDNKEIINSHVKIWKDQIDLAKNEFDQNKISKEICKNRLAKLSYFCKIPRFTRYLWADETLKLNEILIPKSIKDQFPRGKKVLILSHPLLFTLNYAIVEIKDYTESEAFVLNPELAFRLLRDHDGDTLSIVPPALLPLSKTFVPEKTIITTKKEFQSNQLTNDKVVELMFSEEHSLVFTINSLTELYVRLLESKRFDLIEKYKVNFARFYQASVDNIKKDTNQRYSNKNLNKMIKQIYLKVYRKNIQIKSEGYILDPHPTFKSLKLLKKLLKSESNHNFEEIKKIIKTPTNIDYLKEIWTHLHDSFQLIDQN